MSCYGDASGLVQIGTATGALPKPVRKVTNGQSNTHLLVNLRSGEVSFTATVTPRMVVTWPAIQTSLIPNENTLPATVTEWIGI